MQRSLIPLFSCRSSRFRGALTTTRKTSLERFFDNLDRFLINYFFFSWRTYITKAWIWSSVRLDLNGGIAFFPLVMI
jgi:hypothetical protein